jgi:hypothetical protein
VAPRHDVQLGLRLFDGHPGRQASIGVEVVVVPRVVRLSQGGGPPDADRARQGILEAVGHDADYRVGLGVENQAPADRRFGAPEIPVGERLDDNGDPGGRGLVGSPEESACQGPGAEHVEVAVAHTQVADPLGPIAHGDVHSRPGPLHRRHRVKARRQIAQLPGGRCAQTKPLRAVDHVAEVHAGQPAFVRPWEGSQENSMEDRCHRDGRSHAEPERERHHGRPARASQQTSDPDADVPCQTVHHPPFPPRIVAARPLSPCGAQRPPDRPAPEADPGCGRLPGRLGSPRVPETADQLVAEATTEAPRVQSDEEPVETLAWDAVPAHASRPVSRSRSAVRTTSVRRSASARATL